MILNNNKVTSSFITYLSIKDNTLINKKLIEPLVKKFLNCKNIDYYEEIKENHEISDLDFKKVDFSYFYDYILNDISIKDFGIGYTTKFCITIDKTNCPKTCKKTGIFYDEILLYKTPIFYFIYIDIEEIFVFLREHN